VGCEQRRLDAERVRQYLTQNAVDVVTGPESADYVILVTCAVDDRNEERSIARLQELVELAPTSKVIVGGCLPAISPTKVDSRVYRVFSPRSLEALDTVFGDQFRVPMAAIPDQNKSSYDISRESAGASDDAREEYERAKLGFKIRINQGCLLSCSYCVIRKATGRLQSMPVGAIRDQLEQAVRHGEKTVMLVGGDTGAYGLDIGTTLTALLDTLLRYGGEFKLYIHDFNVNWLIKDLQDFVGVIARDGRDRRLAGISFPVQSGSDRILRRMMRPYKSADVVRSLALVKYHAGSLALGTHVIVGFPGETDADFRLTMELLNAVEFDFMTCFPYSEHPDSRSAEFDGKVGRHAVDERLEALRREFGRRVKILA
jgi:MiaB/RimO family radical SAM methylthiotransferase